LPEGFEVLVGEAVDFPRRGADIDEAEPSGLNVFHQCLDRHRQLRGGFLWEHHSLPSGECVLHASVFRSLDIARSRMTTISPLALRRFDFARSFNHA